MHFWKHEVMRAGFSVIGKPENWFETRFKGGSMDFWSENGLGYVIDFGSDDFLLAKASFIEMSCFSDNFQTADQK